MNALPAGLLLVASVTGGPDFAQVDEVGGVRVEARPVDGSSFQEYRVTAHSPKPVRSLCEAAFAESQSPPSSPEVKSRRVLHEEPNFRVTYDQIAAPLVSDRDYVFQVRRELMPGGGCRVAFDTANDEAPPVPPGFVRIDKLRGAWTFQPEAEGTRVTYLIFTEPRGSLPAFVVDGGTRRAAVRSVQHLLEKASSH